jgi:hypothetical protein
MTFTKFRIALLAAMSLFAAALPAQAQTIELPDNTVEGFGATRFENEYKLTVPQDKVSALVAYVQKRYGKPVMLPADNGVVLTGKFADEYFTDVYFDTPSQQLLRTESAVRHRSRSIPGQPQNRKDGRQLMQIKLNLEGEELTRSEVKFPIKYYPVVKTEEDKHPVLGIIDRDFRPEFTEHLRTVGVDPWSLRHSLTLNQRRRRMYLSDDLGAFATMTIDETTSKKLWLTSKFTEIELELNEIRYSSADEATRAQMQRVTDAIKADVMAAIPGIVQDQTPKYNKAYSRLASSSFGGSMIMRASVLDIRVIGTVAGIALFAIWVVVALVLRKRKASRAVPPPPRARPEKAVAHGNG